MGEGIKMLCRVIANRMCFIIISAALVLGQSERLFAQTPADAINSGTQWLLSARYGMGIWAFNAPPDPLQEEFAADDYTKTYVRDTLEAIRALQTVNTTTSEYDPALDWVEFFKFPSTEQIAGKVQILSIAGRDTTKSINDIYSARNADGGFGGRVGYPSDVLDTAWALQGLTTLQSTDSATISGAVNYLLASQNVDGGWGFIKEQSSRLYYTAIVLNTLSKFRPTYDLQATINDASAYLLSQQNTDGGFGSSPSTVHETALSFISLIESGQDPSTSSGLPLQNAINYITTTQLADGSWNDDPYSTALALRALAYVKPNLTISSTDISFSNTMPQTGVAVTITANVRNTGLDSASNITVRFYNGDPASGGTQIGADQVISFLAADSSSQVFVSNTFTGTGSKSIFVQLDLTNQISETSETDNIASAKLWITTQPDLAVFSEDIKPSTFTPTPGTPFTLEYTIRNLGESAAEAFSVSLYDGDPASGGMLLQAANISGIGGTEVRTGTMGVTLTENGPHTLYLVADSGNAISELSKTNNIGTVAVNVGAAPTLADLAITPMDITLSPSRPHAGDTVQISARLRNQGAESADNFTLEIYDGEPETGGNPILSQVFTLPAGAEQTVTTNWAIPTGIRKVNVILDRGNQIAETSETNNRASARVMTDMVDIALSATDLVLNPAHPVVGDTVTLTITAHNQGIKDTGSFNLVLYDGDPNTEGAPPATPLQIFPIANIPGDGSITLTYTFTAAAQTYRFYAATDSDNTVVEMYEDNNLAIRSLRIKGSSEILGPDLIPIKIDASGTTTDPQTVAISGTVHVTIQNNGDDKITTPFNVLIFDDTDLDGRYTQGVDTLLGTATNTMTLWPEGANIVDVPVSGTVKFLHAPLYAFVDSGDAILEQDETNNLLVSCKDCQVVPANPIEPEVKWRWKQPSTSYNVGYVHAPPAIVNLTDDNNDGRIDEKDIPSIAFVMAHENYYLMANYHFGRLWALRGDTGATMFTYYDFSHAPSLESSVAVADIDNDGKPEIILTGRSSGSQLGAGGVLALRNDGTLKWDNRAQAQAWTAQGPTYYGYISDSGISAIADVDADAKPEIIFGKTAINGDGSIKWGKNYYGWAGTGSASGINDSSQVVDLDLDGKQEVVAGFTAYNSDGTIRWSHPELTDGITAIGNLNGDIYPEIVLVTNYQGRARVYLLDHNGNVVWGPVDLKVLNMPDTNFAGYGSPPTIADFDGDGQTEIGIMGNGKYFILDKNGNLKRTISVPGYNSQAIAATVFDLNSDGRPEVMIHTSGHFRIFDGPTGQKLFEDSFGATSMRYQTVQVADVNGDGESKIVVTGYDSSYDPIKSRDAIRVYGSKNHRWVGARKIWNQAGYHVTNVNDDGSIPQYEAPNWLVNNTYHVQAAIGQNPNPYIATNLTASYLRAEQAGTSMSLAVRIGNGGAMEAPAGLTVTFYDGDPSTGTVVGTANTTRSLLPGEYQDITYSWSGGGVGFHHVYAAVDEGNNISECEEDDNKTNVEVAVQVEYPDLKIGAEDVSIPVGPYYEGTPVPITATIRNIGGAQASNIAVRLYSGNPSAGGTQIGSGQVIQTLNSGSAATLTFSFDTIGISGTNQLYIVVDPVNSIAESNEANNMAMIALQVQAPVLPDLAITADDIQFTPVVPREGDKVTVTATIRNLGLATSNVPVRVYLGNPSTGGILVSEQTIYPILAFNSTTTVQAFVDTTGLAGQREVYIVVDPANALNESSKDNNSAYRSFFVQSAALLSTMNLDKSVYQANDTVVAGVIISNQTTSSRSLTLGLYIKDSANNTVATVATGDPLTIDANGTITLQKTWNTGKTLAGTYITTAEISESGLVISRTLSSFSIMPDKRLDAKATTDKILYNPNENAAVTAVVISLSQNYIYENLTAKVNIVDASGTTVFTDTRNITSLVPGAAFTFKSYWNTGTFAPGTYPVTLEVKDATGALIATGMQSVVISSMVNPKAVLNGQVSVDKQSLLAGEALNVSYSVANVGSMDLHDVNLSVLTVHVANQSVYDTLTSQTALAMGGSYTNTGQLDSTRYTAKDYLVILRANISGVEETLASTYFRVEGAPTAPSLVGPADGSDVITFMPVLSANNASDPNDDKISYEFEIYTDSGMTQLVSSSGNIPEGIGVTSWSVPLALTENQTYYWRSRAYDGKLYGPWMTQAKFRINTINDPPTAPTVSSPADNSAVSSLSPILIVNNASDPDSSSLTYNFDLALDPDFIQIAASTRGVLREQDSSSDSGQGITAWQVPVSLQDNIWYYWRAQADDWFDVSPWSTTSRVFVNTVNDAPAQPSIIAPTDNPTVAALAMDIVVNNSIDPDSIVISYFFEIDTTVTFDSPNIIRSGLVTEGQGTTFWHATGLQENTRYYARVKASDGAAESAWSVPLSFFVNTANDAPTAPSLANPSMGAGVISFIPTLSVHNSTDPDFDILTYEFAVYSDSALTTLVSSGSIPEAQPATSWTVPVALTENQTYFWRARAFDGALASAWMPAASFMVNTANDAPVSPVLSAPADGSSLATSTPTLSVVNAIDPDSTKLTYDFEAYSNGTLVTSLTGVPENESGITSVQLNTPLIDNIVYQWRARAFDGDRYGPWTAMSSFSIHMAITAVTATINFDPDTLNINSNGTWVVVNIELPAGYKPSDIDVSSIRLEGTVPAEIRPTALGDQDKDGIQDLMVKFRRSDVINLLPLGESVTIHVNGKVGSEQFEGIDIIRVKP